MPFRAEILLPLYVYPNPGAWDPLFKSIIAHPRLRFTIIINPASGPGSDSLPDENYISALTRLSNLASVDSSECPSDPTTNPQRRVRILGYVATTYGDKHVDVVRAEIDQYAAWPGLMSGKISIDGIFLDETPSVYNPDTTGPYFRAIFDHVKSHSCLAGDRIVVQNPGVVADPRFALSADVLVVFEQTYSAYRNRRRDDRHLKYTHGLFGHLFQEANDTYSSSGAPITKPHVQLPLSDSQTGGRWQPGRVSVPVPDPLALTPASVPFSRPVMAAMIHSCPADLSGQEIGLLVDDAAEMFGWLFFTDLPIDYYSGFSRRWDRFIAAVDAVGRERVLTSNPPIMQSNSNSTFGLPIGSSSPSHSSTSSASSFSSLHQSDRRSRSRFRDAFHHIRLAFFPASSVPSSPSLDRSGRSRRIKMPSESTSHLPYTPKPNQMDGLEPPPSIFPPRPHSAPSVPFDSPLFPTGNAGKNAVQYAGGKDKPAKPNRHSRSITVISKPTNPIEMSDPTVPSSTTPTRTTPITTPEGSAPTRLFPSPVAGNVRPPVGTDPMAGVVKADRRPSLGIRFRSRLGC